MIPNLSDQSIVAWLEKLPDDIRMALANEGEEASEGTGALSAALADAVTPADVPLLVRRHAEDAESFGRARRVRLMAWMANNAGQPGPVFLRLTGNDASGGEEGEAGGKDRIGVLFLEDIMALAKALGPRIARHMASEPAMEAVIQSAFTLEGDAEFRQGATR